MKKALLLLCIVTSLLACKKDNPNAKITYKVTGAGVSQFKITDGAVEHLVNVPFTGTRDTTVYLPYGTMVKLDTKADGPSLQGTIYINDEQVATLTDADTDGDNKTQVKIDYSVPGK